MAIRQNPNGSFGGIGLGPRGGMNKIPKSKGGGGATGAGVQLSRISPSKRNGIPGNKGSRIATGRPGRSLNVISNPGAGGSGG